MAEPKQSKENEEFNIPISEDPRDNLSQREYDALQKLKQSDIPPGCSDRFLMTFLFSRKFDIERTVELLKSHFVSFFFFFFV